MHHHHYHIATSAIRLKQPKDSNQPSATRLNQLMQCNRPPLRAHRGHRQPMPVLLPGQLRHGDLHQSYMRDRKAMDLMRSAVPQDSDPNGANIVIQRVPDRPKLATVSAIPSCRDKGALQLELTQENMDLMPPAESAHDPNIAYFPDASWISGRNHVRCTYSKRKVWRIKPQGVECGCDDAAAEKEAAAFAAAAAAQQFYNY